MLVGIVGALTPDDSLDVPRAASSESAPWGVLPPAGSTATRIVERHWDPSRPGYESVKVWERDQEDGTTATTAADTNAADAAGTADTATDTSAVAAAASSSAAASSDKRKPSPSSVSLRDGDVAVGVSRAAANFDDNVVRAMVGELDTQVASDEAACEPYTGALLAVMSSLANEHHAVRRMLKNELLPREWDRRALPEEGDSIRARLTKRLRGPGEDKTSTFTALTSPHLISHHITSPHITSLHCTSLYLALPCLALRWCLLSMLVNDSCTYP
jgi:hypothetical protein